MHNIAYSIVKNDSDKLLINDDFNPKDPTMTITNGAEYVVRELFEDGYLTTKKLFYRDTDGQIDEIIHDGNGKFIRFSFGGYIV